MDARTEYGIKPKHKGKFLEYLLFGIALAAIAYAAYTLGNIAYDYTQASNGYDSVRALAGEDGGFTFNTIIPASTKERDSDVQTPASIAAAQKRLINFDKLRANNPDIIGWIFIPNSRIDYPIAQTTNNSYYLHHDFYKRTSFTGCIYLDSEVNSDFTSHDSPIYGHHMRNKSMFGSLDYFRQTSFRKTHPVAFVYTPTKTLRYNFVTGQLLTGSKLPVNNYDFDTLTMVTCEYDHVGDHYMVREKLVDSREPGQPDPNDPYAQTNGL